MKEVPRKILSHWMINPSYLIWYPISQLVLYVPYLVAAILPSFVVETPIYLDILWRFFIHMAGFVNSMVYLKMRREIKRSKNKVRSVAGSVTSDENDFNEILIEENAEALLSNLKSSRPSTKS